MEYVMVDKKVIDLLITGVLSLIEEIIELDRLINAPEKKLLNSEEVCKLFAISKRALQYHRNKKHIPYSMIGNRVVYKTSDIKKIIIKGLPVIHKV